MDKLTLKPNVASLPPTVEPFELKVKRGQRKFAIFKHALFLDTSLFESTGSGFLKISDNETLLPTTLPTRFEFIQEETAHVVRQALDLPCFVSAVYRKITRTHRR